MISEYGFGIPRSQNASQKENNSLIGQTLQTSKGLHDDGTNSWFTGVNIILTELNLDDTNCNQAKYSLKMLYKDIWFNKLRNEAV